MSWREIGIVVAMAAGLCGCYRDADEFNAKAAGYVCEYNAGGPAEPFLDRTAPIEDPPATSDARFEAYGGPNCEGEVEDNLSSCSARCEYSPRKARRCLRKLKRALRRGSYNDSDRAVCDRVYECDEDTEVDISAQCHITTQNCAVGDQPPPPVLLALGFLGLWVRRRRS